ncbi:MAG: ABC transporter ATP-binding protein [Spirochaetia bacterium]|nr:ABC transporter ATP-binding protein [Spirochaetia bacterium]
MSLLSVENLFVHFDTQHGTARAVDGISFALESGRTHVLVGESGCGKSVTALAIMGLLPVGTPKPSGRILLNGSDLLDRFPHGYRGIRGSEIAMIFQEPMTALNPVMRVGDQLLEAIELYPERSLRSAADAPITAYERAIELITLTGLPNPPETFKKYPHELSGGMRQRVMIAIALSCRPSLLIADEPTTALDVTTQAQILSLMNELQTKTGTAVLLITHNLGVVAQTGHTMSVMYAGQIVEHGPVSAVFQNPCHPYTQALFGALPSLHGSHRTRLKAIGGSVPPATAYDSLPSPCRFFERCDFQDERCFQKSGRGDHWSGCAREKGS